MSSDFVDTVLDALGIDLRDYEDDPEYEGIHDDPSGQADLALEAIEELKKHVDLSDDERMFVSAWLRSLVQGLGDTSVTWGGVTFDKVEMHALLRKLRTTE